LYLKGLSLRGFKTFADKTDIDFDPLGGITAIVGPNGCGKSNVIDAVRWVLGEQSPKSLRMDALGDVIFAGTIDRKAVSLAEVSLLIENEDRKLPVDYQEVEIKRRTFRDSESEFFINRNACRLKDIRDLFLDTGLGAGSYSIIGQGQVDAILSSKPEERRAVFEEAAGVNKYRHRKEAALKRLIFTDQNLLRLKDLRTEINDNIATLAEQAEKARAYQELKEKLKECELSYYKKVLSTYVEKRTELQNREIEIKADSDLVLQEAKERDVKREEIRNQIRAIEQEERAVRGQLVGGSDEENLRNEALSIEGRLSDKRNELRDLESQERFLGFENERNLKREEQLNLRKAELDQKLMQLRDEIAQIRELLAVDVPKPQPVESSDQETLLITSFGDIELQLAQLAEELAQKPSADRSMELSKLAQAIYHSLVGLKDRIKGHLLSKAAQSEEKAEDLLASRKIQLATNEVKLDSFAKEIAEIEQEVRQIKISQVSYQEQANHLSVQKDRLQVEIKTLDESAKTLNEKLNQGRVQIAGSLEALIQKREDMERQLEELERGLSQSTLDEQRKMSELNRIEVNLAKLEAEVAGVKERVKEDYNMNEDDVLKTDYAPRGGQVKSEIFEIRTNIQNLGLVNPLAIEEYQKQSDRLAFMDKQVADLNASQENLKLLIADLDNLARENFIKIVEAVSAEFSQIFGTLFAGGEAKITLTDPQNVLETGVEIYAKPGGKKLLNLSSLSGGEKALTAISLLFALLRVHPSPFCFLDEVDAALDDANVNRFTQMLKDFSKKVQIIVVTHSKQTMAAADVIYGVTMEEPGVSKIVSMKMAETAAAV
jgi:chromosome segregation protein